LLADADHSTRFFPLEKKKKNKKIWQACEAISWVIGRQAGTLSVLSVVLLLNPTPPHRCHRLPPIDFYVVVAVAVVIVRNKFLTLHTEGHFI
jgi:hypothetical protein